MEKSTSVSRGSKTHAAGNEQNKKQEQWHDSNKLDVRMVVHEKWIEVASEQAEGKTAREKSATK